MPSDKKSRLKDPELYEKLRDDGASKEKAARLSNAAAHEGRSKIGKHGEDSAADEKWTLKELKNRARELDLHGYLSLSKADVIAKLRSH